MGRRRRPQAAAAGAGRGARAPRGTPDRRPPLPPQRPAGAKPAQDDADLPSTPTSVLAPPSPASSSSSSVPDAAASAPPPPPVLAHRRSVVVAYRVPGAAPGAVPAAVPNTMREHCVALATLALFFGCALGRGGVCTGPARATRAGGGAEAAGARDTDEKRLARATEPRAPRVPPPPRPPGRPPAPVGRVVPFAAARGVDEASTRPPPPTPAPPRSSPSP